MSTTQTYIREITFIGRTREAFFRRGNNAQEHKEQLDMLMDLKGKIASSSNQSETIFHNFEEMSPGLFSSFDKSIGQARSNYIMKHSSIETHSSVSFNKLKTLFVLTVMEIGHRICKHSGLTSHFCSL